MAPKRIPRPARIDPPNFKRDAYLSALALAWAQVPNFQLNGATSVLRHLNKIRSITAVTDRPAVTHLSFLFTDPDIEKKTSAEAWEPVRCVGNGCFGRVGLWQRRNKNDDILDEVAIKEAKKDHEVDGYPGLAREAAIKRDLNTSWRNASPTTKIVCGARGICVAGFGGVEQDSD